MTVQTFEEPTQWRPHESTLMPVEVRYQLHYEYESALLTNDNYRAELIELCRRSLKIPRPKPTVPWIIDDLSYLAEQGVPVKRVRGLWKLGYARFLELRQFAAKWKLPYYLAETLGWGIIDRSVLKRVIHHSKKEQPQPSLVEPYIPFISPLRIPDPPPMPIYTPNKITKEEYLRLARERLQQYCERVEGLWREAGWRAERYAHLRDEKYLRRLALQAYLREILNLSWGAIQAKLAEQDYYIENRATLVRTTRRAVTLLRLGEFPRVWLSLKK